MSKKKTKLAYTTSKWKGQKNYQCGICPFAHLEEGVFFQHMLSQHGIAAKPQNEVTND